MVINDLRSFIKSILRLIFTGNTLILIPAYDKNSTSFVLTIKETLYFFDNSLMWLIKKAETGYCAEATKHIFFFILKSDVYEINFSTHPLYKPLKYPKIGLNDFILSDSKVASKNNPIISQIKKIK